MRNLIPGTVSHNLLLIILFCGWVSCQSTAEKESIQEKAPSEKSEEQKPKRAIVFFGNSLTAGYGLETGESFPDLIQNKIDSLQLNYQVVNAGISGETSAGGLSRIEWTLNQPVDIFVLELGANDALRGFDLSATRSNLQGIISKVRAKNDEIRIVVAGMKAPPNMGENYTREFEKIFIDLSQQFDLELIPFLLEGVAGDADLNLPDGIHPNPEGQKIVAATVWKHLEKVL